jgi:hypothetical protein
MLYREGIWVGTTVAAVATSGMLESAVAATMACVGSVVVGTDTDASCDPRQLLRSTTNSNPVANDSARCLFFTIVLLSVITCLFSFGAPAHTRGWRAPTPRQQE